MKLKVSNLLALLAMLLAACGPVQPGCASQAPASRPCNGSDVRHCTVLTVSQGDQVFFGGNDDYVNRDSTYWVDPGGATRYGAIYFGEPDNVQQGFNEKGLAYYANGLPLAPVNAHPGRKPVYGGYTSYPIQILRECATVEEVIAWVQEHQWHEAMHDQLHFADATGDAVVISAGPEGQVAFTRKPAGDGFLVSTNFNVANPSNGEYPCWRYSRAEEMLSEIQGEDELTVERVALIMEAVHVEGPSGWTLYSVVADLQQRLVYVYFMFQYDVPIVLSIDEEIARPHPSRPLSELLPEETQQRADPGLSAADGALDPLQHSRLHLARTGCRIPRCPAPPGRIETPRSGLLDAGGGRAWAGRPAGLADGSARPADERSCRSRR